MEPSEIEIGTYGFYFDGARWSAAIVTEVVCDLAGNECLHVVYFSNGPKVMVAVSIYDPEQGEVYEGCFARQIPDGFDPKSGRPYQGSPSVA